jgi:hypothetical protein
MPIRTNEERATLQSMRNADLIKRGKTPMSEKTKPLSYIAVSYDLFPYVLVHPVYSWSEKGDPQCSPTGRGLGFHREYILAVLSVERGEHAEREIAAARANLDQVTKNARQQIGEQFLNEFYELKGKLNYNSKE